MESSGGRPGKRKRKRGKGSGTRRFGSNKKGSGESHGQKGANQRYNRRFFGVLPETRSTGETTRTQTDAQPILRDLGLWKRKKQTKESGVTPDGSQQTNKKRKGEAQAPERFLHERFLVTLGGYAGLRERKGKKEKKA